MRRWVSRRLLPRPKCGIVSERLGEERVSRTWRYQGSRPVVIDGVLYETTGDRLEARDLETDQLLWTWDDARSEAGERRLTPPAVANGRVLLGTWDGRVVSLDATSGAVRWDVNVGAPCHWQPVMAGGRVAVGLEDGSVVSFDTGDARDDGWPMWGGGPGHNGIRMDGRPPIDSLSGRTMAELHHDTNDRHSCAGPGREARGLETVLVPQVSPGARTRPVTLEHFRPPRTSDDQ